LVVIAIIGMLMALLLPAVQSAKATARRAVCLNNMKQLSTALRNYETSKRELPGYANGIAKGHVSGDDHGRLVTWVIMLFPYMERTDVWSKWNDPDPTSSPDTSLPAPYMELLVCPSNLPTTLDGPWLAYVANCGRRDTSAGTAPPQSPTTTAGKAAEKLANGVFFNRFNDPRLKDDPYYNSDPTKVKFMQFSMSLDKIPDGASNTLMLSENVAAFQYTDRDNLTGKSTGFGPSNDAIHQYSRAFDAECGTGMVWDATSTTTPPTSTPPSSPAEKINGTDRTYETRAKLTEQIGGQKLPFGTNGAYYYARPSSLHPGGVNAAFCGGEILFLREEIDYTVYEQLMTTDGKHSDMQNPSYLLQDSDYK
jgi:type II secretory pathway pseudopilin PulG